MRRWLRAARTAEEHARREDRLNSLLVQVRGQFIVKDTGHRRPAGQAAGVGCCRAGVAKPLRAGAQSRTPARGAPRFNRHEDNGVSAFEAITEKSFAGKWKVIYFWPKDFTFVCPTEITGFDRLARQFEERGAVLLGGSTDNEFSKLAWRREHKELAKLGHWSFADVSGSLLDQLGVRDKGSGVALRATFIVDPDNTIQHVSVNNLNVGRSPEEVLRILDGLQTGELCPCNRNPGGATL
jgi:peroxiredoxin (alkyl hydroperoxide reductase subunit C)